MSNRNKIIKNTKNMNIFIVENFQKTLKYNEKKNFNLILISNNFIIITLEKNIIEKYFILC